jgi:hypothetical protein
MAIMAIMAKQLCQSGFSQSQADVLQTEEPPADCSDMSDLFQGHDLPATTTAVHDLTNTCFIDNAGQDMTAVCDKISTQECLQDAYENCRARMLGSGDFIPVQASPEEFKRSVLVAGIGIPSLCACFRTLREEVKMMVVVFFYFYTNTHLLA